MTREDIDKACKWLEDNMRTDYSRVDDYTYPCAKSSTFGTKGEFINCFKEAMEE